MEVQRFNQSFDELVALLDSPKPAQLGVAQAVVALADLNDSRAIEPLLKMLTESPMPVVLRATVEFLAKNGDERAATFLWQVVCNSEHAMYTRCYAAVPLATISLQSQALLFEGLQHPDTGVQQAVMFGLAKLGSSEAMEALTKVLKTETSQSLHRAAVIALTEAANSEGLALLLEILENRTDLMRLVVISHLGDTNYFDAIGPLTKILFGDKNSGTRVAAAESLGKLKHTQSATPLLKALLEDKNSTVRSKCISGLWYHIDEPIARELIFALHDPVADIRSEVAFLLGATNDSQAIRPLLEVAKNEAEKPDVRESAIIGLGKLKVQMDDKDWLLALLSHKKSRLRAAAAEALGDLGEATAFAPLLKALNDRFQAVREKSVVALGQLNQPCTAQAFLQRLVLEGELDVRNYLVTALGELGDKSATETLLEELAQNKTSKISVIHALGKLGDSRACSAIADFLDDHDMSIRLAVITALARLGEARGIDLLIYLLRDYNYYTRYRAITALAELGENAVAALPTLDWLSHHDRNEITFVNNKTTVGQVAASAMEKILASFADR